jgi:hypothetical protein
MAKKMDRVGKALGATRQFSLKTRASGPLELIQLREEIDARLTSRGGRPSDPEWNLRRVIPLKKASWDFLQETSGKLRVNPGQLAAILLERGIDSFKKRRQGTNPRRPLARD